jgi:NitT/TauT family transport system ATP-binding protein
MGGQSRMNDVKLAIRSLSKSFATREGVFTALADVSFEVAAGEFVAVVGASGCGKSSLLRLIAGLESPSGGEVLQGGQPVRGPGRDRAMVFQDYSLYPWLTVAQNVAFSRGLSANRGRDRAANAERSNLLLGLMGLARVAGAYPHTLSGGMRQRVAIARALQNEPDVLLMDEPFGALDAQTREVMHELILHVLASERRTIVFVTHDVEEAVYLADRIIVLAPGPGRIDSIWPTELPPSLARTLELKQATAFSSLAGRIRARIRETSGLQSDIAALRRLTGVKSPEPRSASERS